MLSTDRRGPRCKPALLFELMAIGVRNLLKFEHNISRTQNVIKRSDYKEIQRHLLQSRGCLQLSQRYLPIEREETNGSNVRHSTVQYMVLDVFES
jgi:hypothetical protein